MNVKTLGVGEWYTNVHAIHIEYLSDVISERNGSLPLPSLHSVEEAAVWAEAF